jgi:hypothetical protein
MPNSASRPRSRADTANGVAIGRTASAASTAESPAAGVIWISGWRRTSTVAIANALAMAIASRSPASRPAA